MELRGEALHFLAPQSLTDEEFAELELTDAAVARKTFEDCVFRTCRMQSAVFSECRFSGCTFEDCDLSVARLDGSRVADVRFVRCKLRGLDWTTAAALRLLAFEDCVLDDANFTGLDLRKTSFGHSSARDACFLEVDLREADLRRMDLEGARIRDADLRGADLRGAKGYEIDPATCRVEGMRASLPEAAVLIAALGVRVDAG